MFKESKYNNQINMIQDKYSRKLVNILDYRKLINHLLIHIKKLKNNNGKKNKENINNNKNHQIFKEYINNNKNHQIFKEYNNKFNIQLFKEFINNNNNFIHQIDKSYQKFRDQ